MKEQTPTREIYQRMKENQHLHEGLKQKYRGFLFVMVRRELKGTHCPFEELLRFAEWALLEIWCGTYDSSKGVFMTHLGWELRNRMQYYLREMGYYTGFNRNAFHTRSQLQREETNFLSRYGREPTHAELAELSGLTAAKVARLLDSSYGRVVSLDERGEGAMSLHELMPHPSLDPEQRFAVEELRAVSREALEEIFLTDEERNLIKLLYGLNGEPLSEREVGAKLGYPRCSVNFKKKVVLKKLRAALGRRLDRSAL